MREKERIDRERNKVRAEKEKIMKREEERLEKLEAEQIAAQEAKRSGIVPKKDENKETASLTTEEVDLKIG